LSESSGTLGVLEQNSNYKSDSSQAAIGQGGVAITPLQLAKIIAGIASGKNFKTHTNDHMLTSAVKENRSNIKKRVDEGIIFYCVFR
jgi:cell division protein FtsI/penicillin-binding protein 2